MIRVRGIGAVPSVIPAESTGSRFLFCRVAGLRARQIYTRPTAESAMRSPEACAMEETARRMVSFMVGDRVGLGESQAGSQATQNDDLRHSDLGAVYASEILRRV